jgi:hypothetical protein
MQKIKNVLVVNIGCGFWRVKLSGGNCWLFVKRVPSFWQKVAKPIKIKDNFVLLDEFLNYV